MRYSAIRFDSLKSFDMYRYFLCKSVDSLKNVDMVRYETLFSRFSSPIFDTPVSFPQVQLIHYKSFCTPGICLLLSLPSHFLFVSLFLFAAWPVIAFYIFSLRLGTSLYKQSLKYWAKKGHFSYIHIFWLNLLHSIFTLFQHNLTNPTQIWNPIPSGVGCRVVEGFSI